MHELKLNIMALKYLRDKHEINLFKGEQINLDDPDVIAALYVAGSQHWPKPATLKQVTEEMSAIDVYEAVSGLDLISKAAEEAKKPNPKTARKRR